MDSQLTQQRQNHSSRQLDAAMQAPANIVRGQRQVKREYAFYHQNHFNFCNQNHYQLNGQEAHEQRQQLDAQEVKVLPVGSEQHERLMPIQLESAAGASNLLAVVPAASDMLHPASATVAAVRLILVSLVGVLLFKLRLAHRVKLDHKRRREQIIGQIQMINKLDDSQDLFDSNSKRNQSKSFKKQQSDSNNQLGAKQEQFLEREERRRRLSEHQLAKLKLPPGPMGLPVVGYLPFLEPKIHRTLKKLSERYGTIYQVFLGGLRVVVLSDAALVREAFKQPVFSGRPDTQLTRILQGYGIINSDGPLWREQRLFLHQAFRKLGAKSLMSGSNGLEAKIQCQMVEFVDDLKPFCKSGDSFQVRPILSRAISSVVGSILMNLTYRKEKEKFDRLIHMMEEGFRLFTIAMPLDFIPILRYLPVLSNAFNKIKKNRIETTAFFQDFADKHRRYLSDNFNLDFDVSANSQSRHPELSGTGTETPTLTRSLSQKSMLNEVQRQPKDKSCVNNAELINDDDRNRATFDEFMTKLEAVKRDEAEKRKLESGESVKQLDLDNIVARNLVEAYIIQQKKHENDGKENYFSDKQLVQIMIDIFSAGLETVTNTIEWAILFMILNPHVQAEIQKEVDTVIGQERKPCLDDLFKMPYTEATIYEVIRRSNVVALGNAHATLEDTQLGGYLIPKGAQVVPNFYAINMSTELWKEPERFDPSRFIVNGKVHKPSYFIPFSVGRRMCLGDLLAKMEIFLFISGILQKYNLVLPEEDLKKPPLIDTNQGFSNSPLAYKIQIRERAQCC